MCHVICKQGCTMSQRNAVKIFMADSIRCAVLESRPTYFCNCRVTLTLRLAPSFVVILSYATANLGGVDV